MKFYNREKEIKLIGEIIQKKQAQLTVIQGKRRVGKTTLMLEALKKEKFLYFFVSKKTEKELLVDFADEIQRKLGVDLYGEFLNLNKFLEFLFTYSKKHQLIIIFDEFQNFELVQRSLFSDFQKFWDTEKGSSQIKFFCIGSMFSLIKKIFTSHKEPLYNRATQIINLGEFNLATQKEMMHDLGILNPRNFLILNNVFGGVAKYWELVFDQDLARKDARDIIRKLFCDDNAYLLYEGKNILIEEFGKNYENYFAILAAIASGKHIKNEIHNYTGISIDVLGGLLKTLEEFYEIIERRVPVLEKNSSKLSSYRMRDNFLTFWFRYIYRRNYLIEIKNYAGLFSYIKRDLDTYLGFAFESLVRDYLVEMNYSAKSIFDFDTIGGYWRRPSMRHDNQEMDIVAVSHERREVLVGECKLSARRINKKLLERLVWKADQIKQIKKYQRQYYIFTLFKLSKKDRNFLIKNDFSCLSLEEILKMI